jgi:hypothetical protein
MAKAILAKKSPGIIFNSKDQDNRRAQLPLAVQSPLFKEVKRVVGECHLNLVTPMRVINFASILVSYAGAQRQQPTATTTPQTRYSRRTHRRTRCLCHSSLRWTQGHAL